MGRGFSWTRLGAVTVGRSLITLLGDQVVDRFVAVSNLSERPPETTSPRDRAHDTTEALEINGLVEILSG